LQLSQMNCWTVSSKYTSLPNIGKSRTVFMVRCFTFEDFCKQFGQVLSPNLLSHFIVILLFLVSFH
jgi:hypothetical protein